MAEQAFWIPADVLKDHWSMHPVLEFSSNKQAQKSIKSIPNFCVIRCLQIRNKVYGVRSSEADGVDDDWNEALPNH